MARPAHYRPEFANQARILCSLGADNADLARTFAVSPATLYRWLHQHSEFAAGVKAGRALLDQPAPSSLFRRATGYEYRAERVFMRRGRAPIVATCQRRVLADPTAAIVWLRNRRPESWRLPARVKTEQSQSATATLAISAALPGTVETESNYSHNSAVISAIDDLQITPQLLAELLLITADFMACRRNIIQSEATGAKTHPHIGSHKSPST